MKRLVTTLSVLLLVGSLAAGCQSTTGKSAGENVSDSKITAEVKAKLVADRVKNLTAVNVDTNHAVVYLIGNVDTAAQKAEAERIAREVKGVQRVVNNLTVTGRAAEPTGRTAAAASPVTDTFSGRHTMTGQVTMVDAGRGHVHLQTAEAGELILHFPPAAIRNVKKGDRLTVEMAVKPAQ